MSNQKKRNFQIEAFKHRVVMDPKYADKTWKILEHAIHEIYNHNASGLSFEELYRLAHTDGVLWLNAEIRYLATDLMINFRCDVAPLKERWHVDIMCLTMSNEKLACGCMWIEFSLLNWHVWPLLGETLQIWWLLEKIVTTVKEGVDFAGQD
ncbi:hypothetical protein V8G54_001649 [Vigna mungo]|uniref:Cullin N-terminal domain-containing protein n=1 Tax=Vigna mungo TaxID=3915 RepID=A0AAQ3P8P3_VIGMU